MGREKENACLRRNVKQEKDKDNMSDEKEKENIIYDDSFHASVPKG